MPPCDGVKYTRIVASDGIGLGVVEMGTGKRGVLMLPEYQASACQWAVEATGLVSAGFHVLLLEYRCTIPSDCPSDTDRQSNLSLDAQAGVSRTPCGRDHQGRHRRSLRGRDACGRRGRGGRSTRQRGR